MTAKNRLSLALALAIFSVSATPVFASSQNYPTLAPVSEEASQAVQRAERASEGMEQDARTGIAEESSRQSSTYGSDPALSEISGPPTLQSIQVSTVEGRSDTLTLKFAGQSPSVDLRQGRRQIILHLGNTRFESGLTNTLRALQGARVIQRISAQDGAGASGAEASSRLIIEMRDKFVASAYQANNTYILEVAPHVESAVARDARIIKGRMSESDPRASYAQRQYTGKPVTFNFQDVPVRTVLQLLADESSKNIIAADSVGGNVTLRLDNIPWDQALEVVLQSKGLDKREEGQVIWVAPQAEIAQYEQNRQNARIALEGKTPLVTDYIRINYHNAAAIYRAIADSRAPVSSEDGEGGESESSFLSSRGRLVLDQRTNTLIVSDIPTKIQQLRQMIDQIDRPVDQVLIEARIVVANSNFARDLGSRFGIFGQRQGDRYQSIGTSRPNNPDFNSPTSPPAWNSDLGSGVNTTSPMGALAYTLLGRNFSLDFELTAMQEEGNGEVISNPRLITSNQREGLIQQGKEIGYVTVTGSGAGGAATPSVQFKEALLELKVTPTITHDGKVFLDLNVKKDDIDQFLDLGVYGAVPTLNRREINTAVLVEDGQTVVIGGVYEFTDRQSIAKVPFLGDVPFLGNLFKRRGKSKEKAEMLIFITPRTIRASPPPPTQLEPVPIQMMTEPAGERG